jgi:hypothetical protein
VRRTHRAAPRARPTTQVLLSALSRDAMATKCESVVMTDDAKTDDEARRTLLREQLADLIAGAVGAGKLPAIADLAALIGQRLATECLRELAQAAKRPEGLSDDEALAIAHRYADKRLAEITEEEAALDDPAKRNAIVYKIRERM